MKIHEYQAKQILARYSLPIPRGAVARTAEEARDIAAGLSLRVAVKAQIHAGGRGKGGGIRLAEGPEAAFIAAKEILEMMLVTPQTGPAGRPVSRVLVEEASEIDRELYLGLLVDRARNKECVTFMASAAGGMDIEEVARRQPEKIIRAAVNPAGAFSSFQARKLAFGLGLKRDLHPSFSLLLHNLYRLFIENDASLVEINPLVITKDNRLLALDAKINFDADGLFRHPELKELRDPGQEEPLEVEALAAGVNYIKLEGQVGCMVNGAGLAMTTMDLIKMAGGEPANFLDVGGGASAERIERAFRILVADANVRVILVNIFGGILRCDRVAMGIIEAKKKANITLPLVVRLQGTNLEEGRRLLAESGLAFHMADELYEAAQKAVALCGGSSNMNY